jgi:hypothetical protein
MRVLTYHVDLINTVAGLESVDTRALGHHERSYNVGCRMVGVVGAVFGQVPRYSEGVRERALKWGALHRGVPGHARALRHHELTVGPTIRGVEPSWDAVRVASLLCRDKAVSLLGALQGTGTRRRGAVRGQLLPFKFTRSGLQVEIVDLVD